MTYRRTPWPWLPANHVQQLLETLPWHDIPTLRRQAERAAGRHPHRRPPRGLPMPVPDDEVTSLAGTLRGEFGDELSAGRLTPGTRRRDPGADFDSRVGRILVNRMALTPADGAAPEVWGWLSTVLVPDLVALRWPVGQGARPHGSRVHGGNRNTFRRPWARRLVLGDLLDSGDPPLGEDELVNIFERSRMARDHRLARILAEEVLASSVGARSAFTRDLTRLVRRHTGPKVLEILEEDELRTLVRQVATSVEPTSATPETNVRTGPSDVDEQAGARGSGPSTAVTTTQDAESGTAPGRPALDVIQKLAGPRRQWVAGAEVFGALRAGHSMDKRAVRRELRQLIAEGKVTAAVPLELGMQRNRFKPTDRSGGPAGR
jgi:hypothetical protein